MTTRGKIWFYELKKKVLSHYSYELKCKRCGNDNLKCLTIDHINGNGTHHRRLYGNILSWLKNNNYPKGYQVLCMNCNWKKEKVRKYKLHISKYNIQYPIQKSLKICDKCNRTLPTRMFHRINRLSKHKRYNNICRDCANDKIRDYRDKIRFKVISHYSPEVKCKCGCDDFDVLTIDHINSDGAKYRQEFASNKQLYKYIIDNNYPNDLQVLCFNCQFIKAIDNKEHCYKR